MGRRHPADHAEGGAREGQRWAPAAALGGHYPIQYYCTGSTDLNSENNKFDLETFDLVSHYCTLDL